MAQEGGSIEMRQVRCMPCLQVDRMRGLDRNVQFRAGPACTCPTARKISEHLLTTWHGFGACRLAGGQQQQRRGRAHCRQSSGSPRSARRRPWPGVPASRTRSRGPTAHPAQCPAAMRCRGRCSCCAPPAASAAGAAPVSPASRIERGAGRVPSNALTASNDGTAKVCTAGTRPLAIDTHWFAEEVQIAKAAGSRK